MQIPKWFEPGELLLPVDTTAARQHSCYIVRCHAAFFSRTEYLRVIVLMYLVMLASCSEALPFPNSPLPLHILRTLTIGVFELDATLVM